MESRCPRALAALGHECGARGIEYHHRLGRHRATLGGAERQHVDARLPGGLRGRRVEPHQRVGEARAVHVHGKTAAVRDVGQFGDFVDAINGAGLARLRDGERRRDHLVRAVPAISCERSLERIRRNLAVVARESVELDAAAEKFRRAAFVGDDVRLRVTEHNAPRRRHLRKRQRIRGRAGRHQEYSNVVLEDFRETALDRRRPVVIAIAERITRTRAHDGVEDRGRDRRGIVAGEVHFS